MSPALSRPWRVRAAVAAVVCGVAAPDALAGSVPGLALTERTAHFAYYTRGGRIDVREVERSLRHVQDLLGETLEGPAEYYRYGSPQEVAAFVGTYASGVTFGAARQIHTTQDAHMHEIVHLVAAQMGDPGPFFQEGLAIAISGRKWRGRAVGRARMPASLARVRLASLAARFESLDPDVAYPLAGRFVDHLIRAHGIARVAAFFRACAPGADRERAFRATFGLTLDEAGALWARGGGAGGVRTAAARRR